MFILVNKSAMLYYFDGEVDATSKPKGSVRLEGCVVRPADYKGKANCFELVSVLDAKTFYIYAATPESSREWQDALLVAAVGLSPLSPKVVFKDQVQDPVPLHTPEEAAAVETEMHTRKWVTPFTEGKVFGDEETWTWQSPNLVGRSAKFAFVWAARGSTVVLQHSSPSFGRLVFQPTARTLTLVASHGDKSFPFFSYTLEEAASGTITFRPADSFTEYPSWTLQNGLLTTSDGNSLLAPPCKRWTVQGSVPPPLVIFAALYVQFMAKVLTWYNDCKFAAMKLS
jgi:hypothetical protein